MVENRLKRISYNGLNKEIWVENRDFLVYRQHPPGSSFLDIEALERSGRNLQQSHESEDDELLPISFVDVGIIDF